MSANSKIEWTRAAWNPVRGCTKISPGRLHCYAETLAERFRGVLDVQTHDEFPERRQAPVPDLEFRRTVLERLEAKLV
jgi:protein gp37